MNIFDQIINARSAIEENRYMDAWDILNEIIDYLEPRTKVEDIKHYRS